MISKELLSEILNNKKKYDSNLYIEPIVRIKYEGSGIKYNFSDGVINKSSLMHDGEINIHELAHKCKDWAFVKHDYIISSYNKGSESVATFYNKDFGVFCSETEPEAIFKACQWILDNKEK